VEPWYPPRPSNTALSRPDASDCGWAAKGNGCRAIAQRDPVSREWKLTSRHWKPLSVSPYKDALSQVPAGLEWDILDVEVLGSPRTVGVAEGSVMLIDLPLIGHKPWIERHTIIRNTLRIFTEPPLNGKWPKLFRPMCVYNGQSAYQLYRQLQEANNRLGVELWEGVVAYLKDSIYTYNYGSPTRKDPSWGKVRFT
jgi:hypothetical protein